MLDTHRHIETPEGIDITLQVAGVAPRALAWFLDLLIRAGVYIVGAIILSFAGNLGIGLFLILFFLLEWFYPILFEVYADGQTPGKKRMGLQVIQDDGVPVNWSSSLTRNLLRTVDLLPFGFVAGVISMVLSDRFQRLGDLAAGTMVVYIDHQKKQPDLPQAQPRPAPFPLNFEEQRAVLNFAERSSTFSEERSKELAQILQHVIEAQDQDEVQELYKIANGLLGNS